MNPARLVTSTLAVVAVHINSAGYAQHSSSPETRDASSLTTTGSELLIKRTPFKFTHRETGAEIAIFEGVTNDLLRSQNEFHRMRFYVSPMFVFVPLETDGTKYSRLELPGNRGVQYSFQAILCDDSVREQAAHVINAHILANTGFQISKPKDHVSNMPILQLETVFKDRAIRDVEVEKAGPDVGTRDPLTINVLVPTDEDPVFRALADSAGGLEVHFGVRYSAKSVKQVAEAWSMQDVATTTACKKLMSRGARFVTAQQIEDILKEIAVKRNLYGYRDPGIDLALEKVAIAKFRKLVSDHGEKHFVRTLKDATIVDQKLREGTNLSAEEFQPMVMLWKVKMAAIDAKDYREANTRMRQYWERNKEKFGGSHNGRGGGLFPGGFWRGRNGLDYDREVEQIKEGYFKSKHDFEQFKANTEQRDGLVAVFEPRGLSLLEKGEFEQNLHVLAGYVRIYPYDAVGHMTFVRQTNTIEREFRRYEKTLAELRAVVKSIQGKLDGYFPGGSLKVDRATIGQASFRSDFGFDGGTGIWFHKADDNTVSMSFGWGGASIEQNANRNERFARPEVYIIMDGESHRVSKHGLK